MANNSSNISIIFVTIKKKRTNQSKSKQKNPPKIQQTCDGYIEHVII